MFSKQGINIHAGFISVAFMTVEKLFYLHSFQNVALIVALQENDCDGDQTEYVMVGSDYPFLSFHD